MAERSSNQFSHYDIRPGSVCWQINSDELAPPLDDGDWEDALANSLIDLAEAHEGSELVCSTNSAESVDFGHQGFSIWIACAGSPPMVSACGDLIQELIPSHQLRKCLVDASQRWDERIRMADGKVWRPQDAATWADLADDSDIIDEPSDVSRDDEADEDSDLSSDEPFSEMAAMAEGSRRTLRRTNAARGGVKVSYYQKKVEKMLGLPQGSVKFVNPNRTISSANQLIRSLRERWDQ